MVNKKLDASCLCGAVQFEVAAETPVRASLCHCKMCRRWGGGLPLSVFHGEVSALRDDKLRWWSSSPWGERGFCGDCGSSLLWRALGDTPGVVSVGALDDDAEVQIDRHIFSDHGGGFYEFADNAPKHTGAQYTAKILSQFQSQHGEQFVAGALTQIRAHAGDVFADEVENILAH